MGSGLTGLPLLDLFLVEVFADDLCIVKYSNRRRQWFVLPISKLDCKEWCFEHAKKTVCHQ